MASATKMTRDDRLTQVFMRLGFRRMGVTDEEMIKTIVPKIMKDAVHTMLDFENNIIGPDGVKALCDYLVTEGCPVKILDLRENPLTSEGASHIADMLTANTNLTTLHLGDAKIGSLGITFIARALERNTNLTDLYLDDNDLGDDELEILSASLKENKTLIRLDIANCRKITDRGLKLFSQRALHENSALRILDFNGSSITKVGVKTMIETLTKNNNTSLCMFEPNFKSRELLTFIVKNTKLVAVDEEAREMITSIEQEIAKQQEGISAALSESMVLEGIARTHTPIEMGKILKDLAATVTAFFADRPLPSVSPQAAAAWTDIEPAMKKLRA